MRSPVTHHPRPFTPTKAFTLLELLVAGTITAALAGFLVILVSNVGTVWTRATNRLSADAQARYVLDQLTLDLQGAQFRDDGNASNGNPISVWFAATIVDDVNPVPFPTTSNSGLWQAAGTRTNAKPSGSISLQMNTPNLADARFGQAGVWLRFFTTRRGANDAINTSSAPVAVGYQVIRRFIGVATTGTAATATGYLLHRAEVRPATVGSGVTARPGVLEAGYNITTGVYNPSTATANNGSTVGDPGTIKVPGTARAFDSVIANNVIDFGLRCYVRDSSLASGLRLVFPAVNASGAFSNAANARIFSSLPPTTPATSTTYNQVFPEVVDVMVRILTDEGARQIALYEQANSPLTVPNGLNAQQYWWQIAVANSHVFTRRIVLKAQSL